MTVIYLFDLYIKNCSYSTSIQMPKYVWCHDSELATFNCIVLLALLLDGGPKLSYDGRILA